MWACGRTGKDLGGGLRLHPKARDPLSESFILLTALRWLSLCELFALPTASARFVGWGTHRPPPPPLPPDPQKFSHPVGGQCSKAIPLGSHVVWYKGFACICVGG